MIYYVSGIKGGVGKTFFTNLLIYYFQKKNITPFIIDTDTSCPDVYYCNSNLEHLILDMAKPTGEGWATLAQTALEHKNDGTPIIVNAPAKEDTTLKRNGYMLSQICNKKISDIISFFVIKDDGVSVDQFKLFSQCVKTKVCVVKNASQSHLTKENFNFFDDYYKNKVPSIFIPYERTDYVKKFTILPELKNKKSLKFLFDENKNELGYILLCEPWLNKCLDSIGNGIEKAKLYIEEEE